MFSRGCHAVCRILRLKSRLSTLISSFFLLPPVLTRLGFRTCRGFVFSLDASKVTSRLVLRSNILKKLLYEPVMIALHKRNGGGGGKAAFCKHLKSQKLCTLSNFNIFSIIAPFNTICTGLYMTGGGGGGQLFNKRQALSLRVLSSLCFLQIYS